MTNKTPIQHTKLGKWIKKIGNYLGFNLRIKGFNRVGVRIIHTNGLIENIGFTYNSRVNKGAALQASLMAGSALGGVSSPLAPLYIALSTASLTPAAGDTTLASETSVAGLGRALGTAQNYVAASTLDGAASYDVAKTFTLTGANTTVVSAALFDAVSTGNLFAEANFSSSAVLVTGDLLQVTWTINI